MINTSHTIILIAVAAFVTLILRAIPFLIFSGKRKMPDGVKRIADMLPPAIMGVLVIYCLKDYIIATGLETVAAIFGLFTTVAIHLWKKNTLLSIAAGTILYMLLIRVL